MAGLPLGGVSMSGGSNSTRVNATATPPSTTPRKFSAPDRQNRRHRFQAVGIDHGGNGVGGIVEPIREFECQDQDEAEDQDREGDRRRRGNGGEHAAETADGARRSRCHRKLQWRLTGAT